MSQSIQLKLLTPWLTTISSQAYTMSLRSQVSRRARFQSCILSGRLRRLPQQHIMVGGLLLCRFRIFAAPSALIIHSIKVKVTQHFTLISPADSTRTVAMAPDTRTVICLSSQLLPNNGQIDQRERNNSGPLRRLEKGEEYRVAHLGRMPDHDFLRPSTSQWSESAIRVRHDISFEVTYQVLEDVPSRSKSKDRGGKGKEKDDLYKPKKLVVSQPLTLFSVSFPIFLLNYHHLTDHIFSSVVLLSTPSPSPSTPSTNPSSMSHLPASVATI